MPKTKLPPRPIVIVPYDDNWPIIYQKEAKKITNVIKDKIVAIKHIGSTAVPGLAAKPIIDIMIGTKDIKTADECIEPLTTIDYKYIPEYEVDFPERRYFNRGENLPNKHFHLHMVVIDSKFWREHLLFRDYLRNHHDVAQEYQDLKQKLAEKYSPDITSYCNYKSDFIQNVLKRAKTP